MGIAAKIHAVLGERLSEHGSDEAMIAFLTKAAVPYATPVGYNILDLSYYDANKGNGTYVPIDWNAAKAEWPGAIVRAGFGGSADVAYDEQIGAMLAAGATFGSYWFFDPAVNAIQQAQKCYSVLSANGGVGKLGTWLDLETIPAGMSAKTYMNAAGSFLNEIRNYYSRDGITAPLGVYSRNSFIDPIVQSAGAYWVSSYPYWQALYATGWSNYAQLYSAILSGYVPPKPTPSAYFGYCVIWQWTSKGQPSDVPGYPPYKKSIDFNVCYMQPVVNPTPPPTQPTGGYQMRVLGDTQNIRSGPGTTFGVVGALKKGDIVTPSNTAGNDSWVEIGPGQWAAVKNGGVVYLEKIT